MPQRAQCAWCRRRIETNQQRTAPFIYTVYPFFVHFLREQGRDISEFRNTCVICKRCETKVMAPKLHNKVPAYIQDWLDQHYANGNIQKARYVSELEKLQD